MTRGPGTGAKISVHASGQIHMRLEARDLQRLAAPLVLGGGRWLHAFELRFLLSPETYVPYPEKMKAKQRAFLIDVPDQHVLLLNLLVATAASAVDEPLPSELLPAAQPLWRVLLRDGRPVLLTGRIVPMDQQNQDEIAFIRHELNPRATLSEALKKAPYVEVQRIVWSPEGGNVILVVPMGKEAVREPSLSLPAVDDLREVSVTGPGSSIKIAAPDGSIVASISLSGCSTKLCLRKNESVRVPLGVLTLSVYCSKLISGKKFSKAAEHLSGAPTINGVQPKNWEYRIYASFDGGSLTIQVCPLSSALRNANLAQPMVGVTASEEIVIVAPIGGIVLSAGIGAAESTASFDMALLLREQ